MIALKLILEGLGLGFLLYLINGAYITAKDKKKKWTMGAVGMALIASNLSGIMAAILQ